MVAIQEFYTAPMPPELEGLRVIDCDTHFSEPPDLWVSRAPAKFRDRVPQIGIYNGVEQWMLDGVGLGNISSRAVGKGRKKYNGAMSLAHDEVEPAAYDPAARLALMDDLHIWAHIVFPNAAGFGGNTFGEDMDPELRLFCVQAYNDAIAEWQAQGENRLFPQGIVPFWDLDAAVKEVQRIGEMGITGIAATLAPQLNSGTPDWGDAAWDPFWDAVAAYKLPVSFHVGGQVDGVRNWSKDTWKSFWQGADATDPEQKRAYESSGGAMRAVAAILPYQGYFAGNTLAHLLVSGVCDRHPDVQFVMVETGIGWIPFTLEYLDFNVNEMAPLGNRFSLERLPSETFRDQFHAMWWFEESALRSDWDVISLKNVLWESDFPHAVCLFPDPLTDAAKKLQTQTPEARRMIMQDNAAELWRIPLPD